MSEVNPKADTILTVLLTISLVVMISSLAYMYTTPQQDNQFTEFYLLAENEEGELVSDKYPKQLTANEAQELVIGVSNKEQKPAQYTVVVLLQEVESPAATGVRRQEELGTYQTEELDHSESQHIKHEVEPTIVGNDLRLTYLLYRGDPPEEPTIENSYQNTYLWVSVEGRDIQEPITIPVGKTNN